MILEKYVSEELAADVTRKGVIVVPLGDGFHLAADDGKPVPLEFSGPFETELAAFCFGFMYHPELAELRSDLPTSAKGRPMGNAYDISWELLNLRSMGLTVPHSSVFLAEIERDGFMFDFRTGAIGLEYIEESKC